MIVKKGTQVKIISGKDKGKTGEILEIDRKQKRVKIKSNKTFLVDTFIFTPLYCFGTSQETWA